MFINLGGINAEEDCIQQGRDIWQAYRTVVDFLFGGICLLFFINLFLFYICSGNTVHSRRRKKERAKLKRNKIAYDPTMQR